MALEEQHVHDRQLVDESVLLELLAQPRADDRYRQRDIVHGLDLGCL